MKTITTTLLLLISFYVQSACAWMETVETYPTAGSTNVIADNITTISFMPEFNLLDWCDDGVLVHSGFLNIYRSDDNFLVESININDFYPEGEHSGQELLTFPLSVLLEPCTQYYITLDDYSLSAPCCTSGGEFIGWWNDNATFSWEFTTGELNFASASTNYPTCNGNCDGHIDLNITGGSGEYLYSWTPDAGSGSLINNLCAGLYSVVVTDVLWVCNTVEWSIEIVDPEPLVLSYEVIPSIGFNGEIDITVTGGYADDKWGWYTYSWSVSDVEFSTDEDLTGLPPGIYDITATDLAGCEISATIVVDNPLSIQNYGEDVFDFYPNPAIDNLTVSNSFGVNATLQITSMSGAIIKKEQITHQAYKTYVGDLEKGVYMVTITDGVSVSTKKLVKL